MLEINTSTCITYSVDLVSSIEINYSLINRVHFFSSLFNSAAGFKERYLSWKSWQQWCMSFIFRDEPGSYAGQDDLNGESPALEVMKFKDPEGYFGGLFT